MSLFLSVSVLSCREKTEKEKAIDRMEDAGGEVEVSRDGKKIKMETDEKKAKIKTNEDGEVKIKEKEKDSQ